MSPSTPPPPPEPSATTSVPVPTTRPLLQNPPRPPSPSPHPFYSAPPSRLPSNPNPNYPQLAPRPSHLHPHPPDPSQLLYPVASSGRGYLPRPVAGRGTPRPPFVFPYMDQGQGNSGFVRPNHFQHVLLGSGPGSAGNASGTGAMPGVVNGIPVPVTLQIKAHDAQDDSQSEDMDDMNEDSYDDEDDDEVDEEEDEKSDSEQHDKESDHDPDEGEDDDLHNESNIQKGREMEELEKEYKQLRNEEQNLWGNLKRHKDEDLLKGQAVKNQRALWDKSLELRFLLQKSFVNSNKLPQEPIRSLFCDADSDVSEAYTDLIDSSKKTLDSILELQQALVANNLLITQFGEANSTGKSEQFEACGNSNSDVDEEWIRIADIQSRMASFRNKSIDKWHRKTQVTTGAAAIKDKLHAFNQSISEQVSTHMRDPSKTIKGMQQNKSAVAVFGNVPDSNHNINQEDVLANGDPELLDDSDFYQQLLKEFFETIDPSSSETAFYAMKRMEPKKRKIVDRRASKSRKIRYNVHEKIVNFMAPRPMKLPLMAPKLFENLFGLKT